MTASQTAPSLYWLRHLQPEHHPFVGDTAYYLGMALQQGYPVQPGAILSTSFFQQFLASVDWVDPLLADFPDSFLHIDVDNWRQLQAIAQRLQDSIQTQPFSSTHQDLILEILQSLDTQNTQMLSIQPSLFVRQRRKDIHLNSSPSFYYLPNELISGAISSSEPMALTSIIRQIWSRFFRAHHLFYWQRMAISLQHVKLAVVLQPAIFALSSGIMTTTATATTISSIWGSGEGLTNGEISPDSHHLDENNQLRCQPQMGTKRYAYTYHHQLMRYVVPMAYAQKTILSPEMVKYLGTMGQNLFKLIGMPLKVEWTLSPSLSDEAKNGLFPWQEKAGEGHCQWDPEMFFQWVQQGCYAFHITNISIVGPDYEISDNVPPVDTAQSFERLEDNRHTLPFPSNSPDAQASPTLLSGIGASKGQVTAPIWIMEQEGRGQSANEPYSRAIVVARNITPAWINLIRTAKGVISTEGGLTSHGAILARELGIPAVVGVTDALVHLKQGDWVVLDGDRGTITPLSPRSAHTPVSVLPHTTTNRQKINQQKINQQISERTQANNPAFPLWASHRNFLLDTQKTATNLMVSMSQPSTLEHLPFQSLDGAGLIRSELMLAPMLSHQPLDAWLQPEQQSRLRQTIYYPLRQFAEAFAPRPIWYRTLDWRSHDFSNLPPQSTPQSTAIESNPLLGYHGALSYQGNSAFFQAELDAVKQTQADGFSNVNLLLPFVRTVEEFQFCHRIIQETGLLDTGKCQVWIMAEVPSILMLLPEYFAAGVQGIAIGSNDLTQLLLAVDRTDTTMQSAFRQDHPAVLRAIQSIIDAARQAHRPCALCGDIVSQYPELIELFIRWGVTTLSVPPDAIATTHAEIMRAEKRLFLEWGRDRVSDE